MNEFDMAELAYERSKTFDHESMEVTCEQCGGYDVDSIGLVSKCLECGHHWETLP